MRSGADSGCTSRHGRQTAASKSRPDSCVGAIIPIRDDTAFEINSIGLFDVQLGDPALSIPASAESKERFEQLLQKRLGNGSLQNFLRICPKQNARFVGGADSPPAHDRDKASYSGLAVPG